MSERQATSLIGAFLLLIVAISTLEDGDLWEGAGILAVAASLVADRLGKTPRWLAYGLAAGGLIVYLVSRYGPLS